MDIATLLLPILGAVLGAVGGYIGVWIRGASNRRALTLKIEEGHRLTVAKIEQARAEATAQTEIVRVETAAKVEAARVEAAAALEASRIAQELLATKAQVEQNNYFFEEYKRLQIDIGVATAAAAAANARATTLQEALDAERAANRIRDRDYGELKARYAHQNEVIESLKADNRAKDTKIADLTDLVAASNKALSEGEARWDTERTALMGEIRKLRGDLDELRALVKTAPPPGFSPDSPVIVVPPVFLPNEVRPQPAPTVAVGRPDIPSSTQT